MERFLLFCQELKEIIALKPELFEINNDFNQKLTHLESENVIFPKELKFYYEVTGCQKKIYHHSIFQFCELKDLKIQLDQKHGKYIFFCQNSVPYYYAYFLKDSIVRTSDDQKHWHGSLRIENILLYILSNTMIENFDNKIFVKMKYAGAKVIESGVTEDGVPYKIKDYPELISRKLSVRNISLIDDLEETAFCDTNRKIFAYFNYYSSNKLLMACDHAEVLEHSAGEYSVVWRKKNGKKVQNPSRYIKGESPHSFAEKLDIIRAVIPYARKVKYHRSNQNLPETLDYFYQCFSKTQNFFDCDMEIRHFEETDSEKEYFHFAYENQGVFCFALKIATKEVFITYDEKDYEKLNLSLEELLIYIACTQAVMGGLMKILCEAELKDLDDLKPFFFEFCCTDDMSCYMNPERKILMICDRDSVFLSAGTEWYMKTLEEDSGVEFSYL